MPGTTTETLLYSYMACEDDEEAVETCPYTADVKFEEALAAIFTAEQLFSLPVEGSSSISAMSRTASNGTELVITADEALCVFQLREFGVACRLVRCL
jgi:hypothetical protein